jgi:hypothetical protein
MSLYEIMMKYMLLILSIPLLALAQPPPLQFQFEPAAFPASINGIPINQPWIGGMDALTPTFCDLDNDGDLDLYCGNNTGYIAFVKNIGSAISPDFVLESGFFDSLVCYYDSLAPTWDWSHCLFSDLNGDGLKDAVLSGITSLGYLHFYPNMGTFSQPFFSPPADTMRDISGNPISNGRVALVDIDGDGKVDIFVGTYNGYITYYHNVGTSSNPAFQLISSAWSNIHTLEQYAYPCFGDLDGDDDMDLLIGTGEGHIIYYRNDGTPRNPQMTLVPGYLSYLNVQKYASPALADIDSDGDLDLFVGRSSSESQNPTQGSLFFYRNDGTPQNPNFRFVTSNYLGWDCGFASTPRLVDIDGDSLPDLISRMGAHLILYHNAGNPGNPNFVYSSSNFGNLYVFDMMPWLVDINGDGLLDLIAGTSAIPGPPGLKLFLNQGTPQVPNWVLYSNDLVPGVFNQASVILVPWTADIDGNGTQDLFVSDDNGYLYFFRNTGSPTNFQFQYITNNWQGLNDGLGAHRYGCFYDIDGDNDLDMFMSSENYGWFPFEKNLRFYRNHGTPQVPNMVLDSNDLFPDLMIWQAAPFVMDIDQDGDGDLFVGDFWGGIRFFKNVTGESPVPPDPKTRPHPERAISGFTLEPNPGNPITTISFNLSHPQEVSMDVYNLLGSKIATLVSGLQMAGEYTYTWNSSGKASGIYIVKLQTAEGTFSKKLMVVK